MLSDEVDRRKQPKHFTYNIILWVSLDLWFVICDLYSDFCYNSVT